jgi:Zn-dependent M28 family amino/carboxypeptidase
MQSTKKSLLGALLPLLTIMSANILADAPSCDERVNNTYKNLLECITLDGVRSHQAAFQAIADANGGTRAAGTTGYDASIDYVVMILTAAGYDVTIQEFTASSNVIAESLTGDPTNVVMVGAHLDSVSTGPGIQDNGSGSAAILEVAKQMAKVMPRNKVRFAWWGAEESVLDPPDPPDLLGSNFYVSNLSSEEKSNIALYMNFDMVGSPNFVRFIYDGSGNEFPNGSNAITTFFESFYAGHSQPYETFSSVAFQSSHQAFIQAGIPAGGIFTGAEGIKTTEQAAIFGGTAGDQYDPCYHLACDTFDNVSLDALDLSADAIAAATLHYAMKKIEKPDCPR